MENEKKAIFDKLCSEKFRDYLTIAFKLDVEELKCEEKSIKSRSKASFMFEREKHSQDVHKLMLRHSSESIAQAPKDSDTLVSAYLYRSKILIHFRKYRESIKDIDTALKYVKSNTLRIELLCHKVVASVSACLGLERNAFEKAKYFLSKVDDSDKYKTKLIKLLEKAEVIMDTCTTDIQIKETKKKIYPFIGDVKINYSEKYGRHLIAKHDIGPGEIIFVEKFYAVSQNLEETYNFCSHCLKSVWSMIPCDFCDTNMYCSERCKNKAWEKYHNIECSILSYMFLLQKNLNIKNIFHEDVRLGLKLVIMALQEAETISNLREEIAEIDSCKDFCSKGMTNGKFRNNTYRSIYSLINHCLSDEFDDLILGCALSLVALVKKSDILGKNFVFTDGKDLAKNEDAIFIGTLMLKFASISSINSTECYSQGPSLCSAFRTSKCEDSSISRGNVISAYSSLINHSCNPNISKIFTNDGKMIILAVSPIAKNSQIFDNYCQPFYGDMSKSERRKCLMDTYQFRCYCEACEKNWSWKNSGTEGKNTCCSNFPDIPNFIFEKYGSYIEILMFQEISSWTHECGVMIGNNIKKNFQSNTLPSKELIFLYSLLKLTFLKMYGNIHMIIPDKCKKIK